MKSVNIKLIVTTLILVLAAGCFSAFLTGCSGNIEVDTTGMYLVVYDGNGGYLGNKTAQVRKMFCQPGSKIPDYPVNYSENQYTVPSLGLAMREGYNLLGWYASDAAEYTQSKNGEYVFLSAEDGNGIYEINPSGEYVRKYEANPSGEYVFVFVEESSAGGEGEAEDTYIYIDASVPEESEDGQGEDVPGDAEDDVTGDEEIADAQDEEGEEIEEGAAVLSVESGFYICNGDETIGDIDDDNLREAYIKAYAEKTYTKAQLSAVSGWQIFDDLPKDYRELLGGLERYKYVYALAENGDEDLDHYMIVSGYASLYSIFIEDDGGDYVFSSPYYVDYDESNEAHQSAQRYSISDKYVFTPDGDTTNPSLLTRYDATMDYWDFTTDTVTEDVCEWDGEKYVLTLIAHWVKKNTVYYHYDNALGQVDEACERLLSDNITSVSLKPGEIIGKKEIIPLDSGRTFVCWSKTPGEYDPWNFQEDVFPLGESELHLYGYYIDGEYTRIMSASGLSAVGKNPAGKYLLVNDIDLGGKEYTSSPLGLSDTAVFTGEFVSLGKSIKNFTFKLTPSKQQAMDSSIVTSGALFPQVEGAKISGITVEANAVMSGLKAIGAKPGTKRNVNFAVSPLCGKVLSGATTEISDCNVTLTLSEKTEGALTSDAYNYVVNYGAFSAYKPAKGALVLTDNVSSIDAQIESPDAKLIESAE